MERLHRIFNRARIDDRQVNELIDLCHGLLADGKVDQGEVEYLHKWLVANAACQSNPIVVNLIHRVNQILDDGLVDTEEGKRAI